MLEKLMYALSGLIIVFLLGALLFSTKAIKNRDDRKVKNESLRNAAICFSVYAILNALRLAVENGWF